MLLDFGGAKPHSLLLDLLLDLPGGAQPHSLLLDLLLDLLGVTQTHSLLVDLLLDLPFLVWGAAGIINININNITAAGAVDRELLYIELGDLFPPHQQQQQQQRTTTTTINNNQQWHACVSQRNVGADGRAGARARGVRSRGRARMGWCVRASLKKQSAKYSEIWPPTAMTRPADPTLPSRAHLQD